MTDTTIGGSTGLVAAGITQPVRLVKIELDVADVAATVTTGGLVKYILPANTYFQFLYAEAVTTLDLDSSTSDRVDIGDASDDDQYVSNATTLTAGTAFTIATSTHTDGLVTGAADFLSVKLTGNKLAGGTADATGIIRMVVLLGDCTRTAKMTVQD
jgi:hypothetical protein